MFKAVIFDFDGTLVDSEWAYALTDIEFIKALGGDASNIEHLDFVGNGARFIIESLRDKFQITDRSVDELLELNDKIFLDIADGEIELLPKMEKLLHGLHQKKIPIAVATGTTSSVLNVIAEQTGVDKYTNHLYSSQIVTSDKPLPDIFLYSAEKLGVKPDECLVLEDSQTGVTAAIRAGMSVIWLDNYSNSNKGLQDMVYKYYPNGHSDLNYREILDLFK